MTISLLPQPHPQFLVSFQNLCTHKEENSDIYYPPPCHPKCEFFTSLFSHPNNRSWERPMSASVFLYPLCWIPPCGYYLLTKQTAQEPKETSNHGKMVTSRTIERSFPRGLAWRKGGWAGRYLERAHAYALCSTVVNAQTTLHLLPVTVFIYSLGMLPPPPWCPPPAIQAPEFLQPLPWIQSPPAGWQCTHFCLQLQRFWYNDTSSVLAT